VSEHHKSHPEYEALGIFAGYGEVIHQLAQEIVCDHIAVVSISETECQCMDCLRKWPKEDGFKSDWPSHDRG
jgi:hypothetical protein